MGQDGNCTIAAIEEFPKFPFHAKQRANGGILLPIFIALYLVIALGTICDEYFVPALEMICDVLGLPSDVAGATFMAAGTSSPEFFTNIMGTFVTKSNLGIGTIVGSAVFNIFGVISVCGLFAGRKIYLDWYPITRDAVIYGITVILLILVLIDEKVCHSFKKFSTITLNDTMNCHTGFLVGKCHHVGVLPSLHHHNGL